MKNRILSLILTVGLISSFNQLSAQIINISTDSTHQTIQGFGGAFIEYWQPELTAEHVQTAFGLGEGEIGLSILRLGINPDSTHWSENLVAAQKAQEMGITIFASPWHTPTNMREDIPDGEYRLRHDMYGEYAEHLNNFVKYMKRNGVDIYAVSVQNEPDIGEWTQWTPEEILNFVRDYGHLIDDALLMAPESFQFNKAYSDPILNDSLATENADIIVGHIYGGGNGSYPLAEEKGKEIWMTEYLLNEFTGASTEDWSALPEQEVWDQTLEMAYTVHKSMTSNMSAYVWWYLKRYYSFLGDGNYGVRNGEVTKRGYTFSHYSKYVRPGYRRIEASGPFGRGYQLINITAYIDTLKNDITLVALNTGTAGKDVDFVIEGMTSATFTPVLSSFEETISYGDEIQVEGNSFSYTLPAKSIITFISSGISVNNEIVKTVPSKIELNQNYPNPFNPNTVISYQLPESSVVSLKVFDMLGREVAELAGGVQAAGQHSVNFYASGLSSGIYFYTLRSNNQSITKKMMLIK